jgi:hypothetical protein
MGKMGILVWLLLMTGFAFALEVPVDRELNITGTVYVISSNLSINDSDGVVVTAENVTLDCGGFSLIGNSFPGAVGFSTAQVNTTLINCDIQYFETNILFSDATGGMIHNVNSTNSNYTLNMTRTMGVAVSNVITITEGVTGTLSPLTGFVGALTLQHSYENSFADSEFNAAGTFQGILHSYMMLLHGSENNHFNNISSTLGGYSGIVLVSSSDNNTLSNINMASITKYGVLFNDSYYNSLENVTFNATGTPVYINLSLYNTITNITAGSGTGVYLLDSDNNTIVLSDITGSSNGAINLINSSNNIMKFNTLRGVGWALYAQNPGAFQNSTGNVFLENVVYTDSYVIVNNDGNNTFSNSTVGNNWNGSWLTHNILTGEGLAPGYAFYGTDLPFNAALIGAGTWDDPIGFDAHPWTIYSVVPAGGGGGSLPPTNTTTTIPGGTITTDLPQIIKDLLGDLPNTPFFKWLDEWFKGCTFGIPNLVWFIIAALLYLAYQSKQAKSSKSRNVIAIVLIFAIVIAYFTYKDYLASCGV